jgi:integrase
LLDQLRERIRYKHYSVRTEDSYVHWARFFIRWSGMRHPRDMGPVDVERFLAMLANERLVAVSTHNQGLSALLFLYREVMEIDLPWLANIDRPSRPRRIPVVLTPDEVSRILAQLPPATSLVGTCCMAVACGWWKGCG